MGCSTSNEAAIHELRNSVNQISEENASLKNSLETSVRARNGDLNIGTPPSVEFMKSSLLSLEENVKFLNEVGGIFADLSKESSSKVSVDVEDIIDSATKLNKKIQKTDEIMKEVYGLREEEHKLELQISTLEESIKKLEQIIFSNEEVRKEHHLLYREVSEQLTKKEILVKKLEDSAKLLENLNVEIKTSGLADKASVNDYTNFEVLLRMTDLEVNIELKNIETELDVLAIQMRDLKAREA